MLEKKPNNLIIIGIIIIIIGTIIGIIPFFLQIQEHKIENNKIDDFLTETSIKDENVDNNKIINSALSNNNKLDEKYSMVLEIPKIKFKRGIYSLDSQFNSIEYNVAIMQGSTLPDIDNSNLILAAHNGTGKIAYFNKLHKLEINDEAYIYYYGTKYKYIVADIYDVLKDGNVEINRNHNKNTLTLVTCKKDTDDRQLVIILYLDTKEIY